MQEEFFVCRRMALYFNHKNPLRNSDAGRGLVGSMAIVTRTAGPCEHSQGITRRDLEAALAASWASQRVMFLKPDGNLPF